MWLFVYTCRDGVSYMIVINFTKQNLSLEYVKSKSRRCYGIEKMGPFIWSYPTKYFETNITIILKPKFIV